MKDNFHGFDLAVHSRLALSFPDWLISLEAELPKIREHSRLDTWILPGWPIDYV